MEFCEAHRYGRKTTDKSPILVGAIVLVHDDKPCGFLRITRVNQLLIGKDRLV